MNEEMSLSVPGANYLKQLEEVGGRCRLHAYDDGTGTPTIAWGCTHGVRMGDTITEDQGVQMFNTEIRGIEAGLRQWCTRKLDQDDWDYCIMFGFNLGWGKCGSFKVAMNDGNPAKIRAAAMLFTHAHVPGRGTVEWPGLVSRRKQELAYWDTHHNLTSTPLPVPVAVDGPKSQALPPPKPPVVVTAVKSRKVWAALAGKVALVGGILTNGVHAAINSVFNNPLAPGDAIKNIDVEGFVGDLQPKIEATKQVAGWLNLQSETICAVIVLAALGYILLRGAADKQATQIQG